MKDVLDVYKAGDSFNEEEQRMIISAVTGQAFFVGSSELRACVKIKTGKTISKGSVNGRYAFYAKDNSNNNSASTTRVYTCANCGDVYTQELGNQAEEVTSYVEYLFEQYSPYMIWVFLATAGVWSIFMGIMIIIAHKNEEKEKAKRMLVNYLIGLVVIFGILVAAPYLVRGIAALVTKKIKKMRKSLDCLIEKESSTKGDRNNIYK